eukprot:m.36912 g.36912  ORF g.36912 m.36912 type:complete len:88 (+) comp32306_c0_seq4:200-463(+)
MVARATPVPQLFLSLSFQGYSALHHAVRRSYIECIQILLRDDRTNVNAKTKDTGSTPLHLCLSSRLRKKDRLQMVRILLEKGADVDR